MKAIQYFLVVCIIVMFVSSSVFAEEEVLNVTVKGLDQVEGYLVENELIHHNLPLSTPVTIERGLTGGTFVIDGREEKIFYVKVTVTTDKGKFTGNVNNRDYLQFPGEEYYGLLKTALAHACQGPENTRQSAKADKAFSRIRQEITGEASRHGYPQHGLPVVFFDRRSGSTEVTFRINSTLCKVDFSENSPKYSMVFADNVMRQVDGGLDEIFKSVPDLSK